ncbi:glycoside hydrolase family 71 protein, partial [Athelia psychrophila]
MSAGSALDFPSNAAFPADAVFALAMLTAPANVTLTIGSQTTVFYADAGLTMGSVPFPAEYKQTPTAVISRAGTKFASGSGGISVNQTGCTIKTSTRT